MSNARARDRQLKRQVLRGPQRHDRVVRPDDPFLALYARDDQYHKCKCGYALCSCRSAAGLVTMLPAAPPKPRALPTGLPPRWALLYGSSLVHTVEDTALCPVLCFESSGSGHDGEWFFQRGADYGYAHARDEAMARALGWEERSPGIWRNPNGDGSTAEFNGEVWSAFVGPGSPIGVECPSLPHAIAHCRGET